jgi:anti-anti-sigma factor
VYTDDLTGFDLIAVLDGDHARVAITGDLDINSAPRLITSMMDLTAPPIRRIELDCRGVTFLDSVGVRALIVIRNEAEHADVDLLLVEPSMAVSRVVEMTGLTGFLTGGPLA